MSSDSRARPITTERLTYWPPPPEAISTVREMGNTIEVTTSRSPPPDLSRYQRLSKTSYLDSSTGEICTYHSRDKPSVKAINRTFNNLRRLILANFSDDKSVMWTFTVAAEFSATPSDLYHYYGRFWRKVKYCFSALEYLAVIEPHQSGRFHLHVLVKSLKGVSPSISIKFLRECWPFGAVSIRRVYDIAGLAGYLTSKKKRQSWVQRYIPGTRLFRYSGKIKHPHQQKMNRRKIENYVVSNGYTFKSGYRLNVFYDDGNKPSIINTVTHELFERE